MNTMNTHTANACDECRTLMTRRRFLHAAGLAGASALASLGTPQVAYANHYKDHRDILVSIFLRGGADGLTLCAPHGDKHYYAHRPTLSVPPPDSNKPMRCTDIDGFYGFPPGMSALLPAYKAGHLLCIHAVGSQDPSRSHFDAQRHMEIGKPEASSMTTGVLGRNFAALPPLEASAPLRTLSIENAVPQLLEGGSSSLPIPDPANFRFVGSTGAASTLRKMYSRYADPLKSSADTTFKTISLLGSLGISRYKPAGGAVYPDSDFGRAMRSAAALIKAEVGVEAVQVDVEGWDTHADQGTLDGMLHMLMQDFSSGLSAFHTDIMAGRVTNVTVVVLTEFGRVVRENGSKGTDHGHGTAMFVLGKNIAGGRVLAKWPGLDAGQLYENQDLMVTTDYRDILAEILQNRLGNTSLAEVFPDYKPTFHGITKS